MQSLEPDGAWTFELPLPNPERQEHISRFVDGMRAAIATPLSMIAPNPRAAGETAGAEHKLRCSNIAIGTLPVESAV